MKTKRLYPISLSLLLALSIASPSHALNNWQAGALGVGVTAATILAIEHILAPLIADQRPPATEKQRAAQLARRQEEIQEIRKHYTQQPFVVATNCEDLLHSKQRITHELRTVHNAYEQWKSSKLQNAESIMKEIEACKTELQQHDHALDQALAQCISEEAFAHYKEELDYLKSSEGLDADTIERIVIENHVREPYRRHTYLHTLDQFIEHCRQYKAPTMVTNSLEILRKQASRLLGPNVVKEMRELEEADRQARDFEIQLAGKRSMKEFFDAAQHDLSASRGYTEESRQQIAQFVTLMQQQCLDNAHAVANCTMLVQNTAGMMVQANQEQQQLKQNIAQLHETIRDQEAQTRNTVHVEGVDIRRQLAQALANGAAQQNGDQAQQRPSAPPYQS